MRHTHRSRLTLRIFSFLPLLLCLAAWFWSATHGPFLTYSHSGTTLGVGTAWSTLGLGYAPSSVGWWGRPPTPSGFDFGQYAMSETHFWPIDLGPHSFAGFRFHPLTTPAGSACEINIPYWFLTLFFTAMIFAVWYKTSSSTNPAAFSIEPSPGVH